MLFALQCITDMHSALQKHEIIRGGVKVQLLGQTSQWPILEQLLI